MALEHTDQGLPIWTEDTVPEHCQKTIKKYKGRKPWLDCQGCGLENPGLSNKLYHCTGCIKDGVWDRARYCGVTCQKKDWKSHQWMCVTTAKVYNEFQGTEEERKLYCMRTRQFRRRECALLGLNCPTDWATRQAFMHCQIENPRQTRFTFWMAPLEGMDLDSIESIILPCYFTFSPAKSFEISSDRVVGQWGFAGVTNLTSVGWTFLDNPRDDSILSPRLPQWPYVFAQCCLTQNFHPTSNFARLYILLEAIRNFPDPEGLLEGFIPPKFQDRWDLPVEKLWEWMSLMGQVIGSL